MKEPVSVRINGKILLETKRDAKRKGFKYYSHYVEQALLHELYYNEDTQAVSELKELRDIIDKKLERFEISNDENIHLFDNDGVNDPQYYINEVKAIYNNTGYVVVGVIENFATKCGLTTKEFLSLLDKSGFTGVITD